MYGARPLGGPCRRLTAYSGSDWRARVWRDQVDVYSARAKRGTGRSTASRFVVVNYPNTAYLSLGAKTKTPGYLLEIVVTLCAIGEWWAASLFFFAINIRDYHSLARNYVEIRSRS